MKVLCVLSQYAYGRPERGENYDYVHFVPALRELGHEVEVFDSGNRSSYRDFAELNAALLDRVIAFRPEIIFCVLMHYEIWFDTLDAIRSHCPALVVNWGTDDSWKFVQASRFFAAHVDLHVTTAPAAAERATALGHRNVLLSQWAASDGSLMRPIPAADCRRDVSFVGSLYGYRAAWIAGLRDAGITVDCFGHGSENGVVDTEAIARIVRESRIALNFSGEGPGGHLRAGGGRQIKARTFEVPGSGGFLLTESAPSLERYYQPGREVATFSSPDELVRMARHYLAQPEQRDAIANAGYERTAAEHTYRRRFEQILDHVCMLSADRMRTPWGLSPDALAPAIARFRRSGAGWLRSVLVGPLRLIFGFERGPRAARRILFELSWRCAGERTFRAGGLPGRLFYLES